jgi:PHD/YefM family antitoxin component YafN of YafNO toxin-antitoxin module
MVGCDKVYITFKKGIMETVTFKSYDAHRRWRDMMDAALTGKQVVIERYDKPQAVLVNYEQWQRDQAKLKEFEALAEVRRIRAKLAAGEMGTVSSDELLRLLGEKFGQDYVDKVRAYVAQRLAA